MKKLVVGFLVALAWVPAYGDDRNSDELVAVMRAMFLAEQGQHLQAAELMASLSVARESGGLMREAYREALGGAKDPERALSYAEKWSELGGGVPSLQARVHLLLALGRSAEARDMLIELKKNQEQTDDEARRLLMHGKSKQSLAIGRQLFDDSAAGNFLFAKLAIHFRDWSAANRAIDRGLIRALAKSTSTSKADNQLFELHLAKLQLAALQGGKAIAALPQVDTYVIDGCPGAPKCDEAKIMHALKLVLSNQKWQEAFENENADEAILTAGRYLEGAELRARARIQYRRLRGKAFDADMGIARIYRDEGDLLRSLEVLNAMSVTDDYEFGVRETTAAGVLSDLYNDEHAIARVRLARKASPDNRDLLYMHSYLAESIGDIPVAISLMERFTELYPSSARGWNGLGYTLADHNMRLDEAELYIKRALAIAPNDPNFLDSLGWVYYRQGRLSEARKFLLQAAKNSDSAVVWAHLGEVYWQLGEHALAREAFATGRRHDANDKVLEETLRRLRVYN